MMLQKVLQGPACDLNTRIIVSHVNRFQQDVAPVSPPPSPKQDTPPSPTLSRYACSEPECVVYCGECAEDDIEYGQII